MGDRSRTRHTFLTLSSSESSFFSIALRTGFSFLCSGEGDASPFCGATVSGDGSSPTLALAPVPVLNPVRVEEGAMECVPVVPVVRAEKRVSVDDFLFNSDDEVWVSGEMAAAAADEDDNDEDEEGGSPKGRKRARANTQGDAHASQVDVKGKMKEEVKTLPRDDDGWVKSCFPWTSAYGCV